VAAKSGLGVLAIALTAAHAVAGARNTSPAWVTASRVLSPPMFLTTIGIFYLVRLTEG
jgi:hypothetical protein